MTTVTYPGTPMLARIGTIPPSRPALERMADLDAQRARHTRIPAKPRHNGSRKKEAR
jgi:hypothetical protein